MGLNSSFVDSMYDFIDPVVCVLRKLMKYFILQSMYIEMIPQLFWYKDWEFVLNKREIFCIMYGLHKQVFFYSLPKRICALLLSLKRPTTCSCRDKT
jgi:hypothetical protein